MCTLACAILYLSNKVSFKDTLAISEFSQKKPRIWKEWISQRNYNHISFFFLFLLEVGLRFRKICIMSMTHHDDVINIPF